VTRTLPTGVSTQAGSEQATFVHLLEMQFAAGTVYLTDAPQNVLVDSQVWTAVGGMLEHGATQESADANNQVLEIALSGVDQTIVSAIQADGYRGRLAILRRVYFAAGAVVGTAWERFRGYMNEPWRTSQAYDAQGNPQGIIVRTTVVSRLAVGERLRGIKTNLASHQRIFSGDLFMQFVESLANRRLVWGTIPMWGGGTGGEPDYRNKPGEDS